MMQGVHPPPLSLLSGVFFALCFSPYGHPAFAWVGLIARAGIKALLLLPAAWVATEFMRGYLFGGFPWVPLGNSQVEVLPVAQLASVLGVYGLSALVALVNAAIAYALLAAGATRFKVLAATVALLGGVGAWGASRVADGSLTRQGEPV